ncbi:hypothetical protein GQ600_21265 [Phytophthora cactorum]|nr:hypothetical protein GQ600_21265 [Phytophthora cactorum]
MARTLSTKNISPKTLLSRAAIETIWGLRDDPVALVQLRRPYPPQKTRLSAKEVDERVAAVPLCQRQTLRAPEAASGFQDQCSTSNYLKSQADANERSQASAADVGSCTVQAESHSGWTTEDCKHEAEQRFAARREEVNANSILAFERRGKASSKPRSKAERFSLSDCYKTLKKSTRFMRSIAMLRKRQLAAGELTLNSESEGALYNILFFRFDTKI